eukprot:COSAG02_NODE_16013_length_1121_cov_1.023483_1_plen_93_part_10
MWEGGKKHSTSGEAAVVGGDEEDPHHPLAHCHPLQFVGHLLVGQFAVERSLPNFSVEFRNGLRDNSDTGTRGPPDANSNVIADSRYSILIFRV